MVFLIITWYGSTYGTACIWWPVAVHELHRRCCNTNSCSSSSIISGTSSLLKLKAYHAKLSPPRLGRNEFLSFLEWFIKCFITGFKELHWCNWIRLVNWWKWGEHKERDERQKNENKHDIKLSDFGKGNFNYVKRSEKHFIRSGILNKLYFN